MSAPQRDPFALCGTTIDGKYRVLSVVGEGGFGVVYRGLHEGFDEPIAIKCLKLPPHFDLAAQNELVRRLRDEGRLMRRLSQRTAGIVQAHDVGSFVTPTGARVPYLVLEWLDGHTLADEFRARRARGERGMSFSQALAMLDPAAQALAVAHAEKIAHRDIKPENLFLVASGGKQSMKVLDFGIAKVFADASSPADAVTAAGPSAFTPNYGAPEQFDKKRGASGPWTDVFAFALVFVEAVAGRRALDGEDVHELYLASIDPSRRPTLRARGVNATAAVEQVLKKALHVAPRGRYPDAGAFWEALKAAVHSDGDVPEAPPRRLLNEEDAAVLSTVEYLPASGTNLETATTVPPDAPAVATMESASTTRPRGDLPGKAGADITAPSLSTLRPAEKTQGAGVKTNRGRLLAVAGAAVLALAAAGVLWKLGGPAKAPSSGAPLPAAAVSATEGDPISKNSEALALYKDAMQAAHDGELDVPTQMMKRAVELDRKFGAAHLRLAMWTHITKRPEAREHYQAAYRHRDSLGEYDRELLHAMEPYVRQPWDPAEWEKRLEAMTTKFPRNPELFYYLAAARFYQVRIDAAIEACDRTLEIDKETVPAWILKGELLSMKGDAKAQLDVLKNCLDANPTAMGCVSPRAAVSSWLGECQIMKDDAKRLVANTPKAASAYRLLAVALYATGEPPESVLEALQRSASLLSPEEQRTKDLEYRVLLAESSGDFETAKRLLLEWQKAVAGTSDQNAHGVPALRLTQLYRELGQLKKADEVAAGFLNRMGAWTEHDVEGDWTLPFLRIRRQAGSLSLEGYARGREEFFDRFRAKWTAAGRPRSADFECMIWSMAYGAAVENEQDAREALEKLPVNRSAIAESGRSGPDFNVQVGKAYLFVGQFDRAIPSLRRAAISCSTLTEPLVLTEAQLYLGMALEGTGDIAGARAAYEVVIQRWGKAKPRSVTAEKAAQRLKALGKKR